MRHFRGRHRGTLSRWGIDAVRTFIIPLLDEAADEALINHRTEDPKSLFQEWAQAQGYSTPQYVTRSATGPDHSKLFEVDVVTNGKVYGSGMDTASKLPPSLLL